MADKQIFNIENYVRWYDIYHTEFKQGLNSVLSIRDDMLNNDDYLAIKDLCLEYCKLVDISCKMLKWYLANNGLFQTKYLDVLKECFYIELFEDGMTWINAYYLTKMYKEDPDISNLDKMIVLMTSSDKMVIFANLKEKMEAQL